jgi:hypothetical protein
MKSSIHSEESSYLKNPKNLVTGNSHLSIRYMKSSIHSEESSYLKNPENLVTGNKQL